MVQKKQVEIKPKQLQLIYDLMAGTTVEVEDKFGNKYEPIWSVKFKKVN